MKARKRLTREESKELTRLRLIEAAERLFIRRGFDDASVEEISEMAGYSRGAFYSNFDNKEQVFLAVIDRRRPKALEDILQRVSEPVERIAAVRKWFANQWRLKDFIALRMEFSRRAFRDRSVRTQLAELLRQELSARADRARHGSDLLRQMGDATLIRLTSCPTLPRTEASGKSTASSLVGEIEWFRAERIYEKARD